MMMMMTAFSWQNRDKSILQKLLALGAVLHLLGNMGTTSVFMYTSHLNYPGGEAIYRLHQLYSSEKGSLCIRKTFSVGVIDYRLDRSHFTNLYTSNRQQTNIL